MSLRERRVTSASNPDSNITPESSSDTLKPQKTPSDVDVTPSFYQRALKTTAHLSNLLPTGTLLAFHLLTPISTSNGSCDAVTRSLTFIILLVLGLSCFLACFTDSFKATDGQVYYGFATWKGLFVFDYPAASQSGLPGDLTKFRLSFIDVIHSVLSVLVFVAVALRDKNVVSCFYPAPGKETQEVLDIVPISIGLFCSLLFMIFPTRRHGIGFPVTSD